MIAYLLLVQISRMFSSMPGLAAGIAADIRDGNLKKYLLQPIDMIAYLITYRGAHKLAYIATSAIPYGLLFWCFRDSFDRFPDPLTFLGYISALVMGFFIGFFFEATIGMIGFWFLEVTSFLYIINTINFFVSGHMFPLDLLPTFLDARLEAAAVQLPGLFPGHGVSGQDRGDGAVAGAGDRTGLVRAVLRDVPAAVRHGPAALQRVRRVTTNI